MNTEAKAAFGLGVIAILVAIASLVFALTARNRLEDERLNTLQLKNQVSELQGELATLNPLRENWDMVQGRMQEAARQADGTQRQLDRIISQTESALQTLGNRVNQQIQTNRQDLAALANTVRDIERRVGQLEEATPRGGRTTPTGGETASTGQTTHRIASGDTFSALARTYGVTIRALENANPNVNPNRLQVGQEIIIPEAP